MADQAKAMKAAAKKGEKPLTPSRFGSHTTMIDEEGSKNLPPNQVACLDEFGVYITERIRLDNGCADPNRFAASRVVGMI
jgi:hypothetical protein